MSMRLGILVPNINQGGTERVAANLADEFIKMGFDVMLITIGNNKFPFPCDAKLIKLDVEPISGKLKRFISRYNKIRTTVSSHKIDVILSMGEYSNLLCSLLPKHILRVIRITNSLSRISGAKSFLIKTITKVAMRRSDLVILPTKDLEQEYSRFQKKIKVIANPIHAEFKSSNNISKSASEDAYWLHIGQFVEQKNHYGLLSIYKNYLVASKQKRQLLLLGKGKLEEQTMERARKLQISEFVLFKGWADYPVNYINDAIGLLLPSHWEGFPNVLIEAMTQAVPVIAYDCRTGPRDILQDGTAGLLVPYGDEEQFVRSMLNLESDQDLFAKCKITAKQRSKDFEISVIVEEYIKQFQEARKV